MVVMSLEETCLMCPRRGTKRCSLCKKAQYCSKECQTLDFKAHKTLCSSINEPQPAESFRRVLLFPGGEKPPVFHWMKVKTFQGHVASFEALDFTSIFGAAVPVADFLPALPRVDGAFTIRSNIQNRDMFRHERERIIIFNGDNTLNLPTNKGVRKFTRANVCGFSWGGPVIVARTHFTEHSDYVDDMELLDARHVADHLSSAQRTIMTRPNNVRVVGCVISSDNEVAKGRSKYLEHVVDGCDNVFIAGGSSVTNLLGIPLLIRKAVLVKASEAGESKAGTNVEATVLKRDIMSLENTGSLTLIPAANSQQYKASYYRTLGMDLSHVPGSSESLMAHGGAKREPLPGFGKTTPMWNGDSAGRALVVRADGKPLLEPHLEVICEYIKEKVELALRTATSGLNPKSIVTTREQILDRINKAAFLDFFDEYKKSKGRNHVEWRDLPSPYDVDSIQMSGDDLAARYAAQKTKQNVGQDINAFAQSIHPLFG